MKIRTEIDNVVGRYNVQVSTFDFTANEEQKILDHGDPLIEVGGTFEGSASRDGVEAPVEVSFILPTATRRLRSDFPVKQVFDLEDDENSDIMAKVWGDTIAARCTAAKTNLISLTSPFEGETVVTV